MNNKLIYLMFFLLLSFTLVSADPFDDYGCFGAGMMGGYGYGFMWIFGAIFWILVIVALILLIIWLSKQIAKEDKRKKK